ARCAAPPAAAITISTPLASALEANAAANSGERCAEMTRHSCATPNFVSVSSALRIVSQSEVLPITTATRGLEFWISDFGFRVSLALPLGLGLETFFVAIATPF